MSKAARRPVKALKAVKPAKPAASRTASTASREIDQAPAVVPVLLDEQVSGVPEAPAPLPPSAEGSARAGLRLEASCLLRDSLDFQFHLLSADFGGGEVLVDGSAVERVDTAGLQLLVAFVQHQTAQGRKVSWTSASDALGRAANRLGLAACLHLPGAEERAS
jgi:phospholipid transport system transporter-binding protein